MQGITMSLKRMVRCCLILCINGASLVLYADDTLLNQPFNIETKEEELVNVSLDHERLSIPDLYEPAIMHNKSTLVDPIFVNYYASNMVCGLFLEMQQLSRVICPPQENV
jgi:hypothetical protein